MALVSASLQEELSVLEDGATYPTLALRGNSKQSVDPAVAGPKTYSADYSGILFESDMGTGRGKKGFNGKGTASSTCAVAANYSVIASICQNGMVFMTPTSSLEYSMTVMGTGATLRSPSRPTALRWWHTWSSTRRAFPPSRPVATRFLARSRIRVMKPVPP